MIKYPLDMIEVWYNIMQIKCVLSVKKEYLVYCRSVMDACDKIIEKHEDQLNQMFYMENRNIYFINTEENLKILEEIFNLDTNTLFDLFDILMKGFMCYARVKGYL